MDLPSNFSKKELKNLSDLSASSDLPRTPLERGAKNYFPEGVKGKKESFPFSQTKSFHGSFGRLSTAPTHSPELLRLHDLSPKTSVYQDRHYQQPSENFSSFFASINFGLDEKLMFPENQREVLLNSFHLEQIKHDRLSKKQNSPSSSVKRRLISQTENQNQMRSESVETFFPDIFSLPSFYDRPNSAKSAATCVTSHDDDIKPSQLHNDKSVPSPHSDYTEAPLLSTESSTIGESSSGLSDQDLSSDSGFKVHIRIKPLEDQDAGMDLLFCSALLRRNRSVDYSVKLMINKFLVSISNTF